MYKIRIQKARKNCMLQVLRRPDSKLLFARCGMMTPQKKMWNGVCVLFGGDVLLQN
jgi:hypothetical protein